jgi:hypothetical protein
MEYGPSEPRSEYRGTVMASESRSTYQAPAMDYHQQSMDYQKINTHRQSSAMEQYIEQPMDNR